MVGVVKSGKMGQKTKKSGKIMGHKTKNIEQRTACKVRYSRYDYNKRMPMKVTIKTDPQRCNGRNLHDDTQRAIELVEEILFDYINERGANNRLLYELRSGSMANSLLPRDESGAVQIDKNRWFQLLEIPCIPRELTVGHGSTMRLRADLIKIIMAETNCHVTLYTDGPGDPLRWCKPYVLVQGRLSNQVNRATEMITNARHDSSFFALRGGGDRESPRAKFSWNESAWAL